MFWRISSFARSLSGRFSHLDNRRLPIGVSVESTIEIKVFSRPPLRLKSISRFLRVAASNITLSLANSIFIPWICGKSAFCVSLAYCNKQPAASIPTVKPSQEKIDRSLT